MVISCVECGTKFDGEIGNACPGCGGRIDQLTEDEEKVRSPLLKVGTAIYAEYVDICRNLGLTPEPCINFESDDDVKINIQSLRAEHDRRIGKSV